MIYCQKILLLLQMKMETLVNKDIVNCPSTDYYKVSGIYKLILNNKIYIGSAINLYSRINLHKFQLLKNKHHNILVQRKFNKIKTLSYEITETCNKQELIKREQHYIDVLKPELNLDKKAGSRLGSKLSKESIIKRNNTIKSKGGFHHSEEAKLKIGKAQTGVKRTKEVKLKTTGSNNPNAKFTNDDILNILNLLYSGKMIKEIALIYNCNRNTIARIKSNKTYTNINNGL